MFSKFLNLLSRRRRGNCRNIVIVFLFIVPFITSIVIFIFLLVTLVIISVIWFLPNVLRLILGVLLPVTDILDGLTIMAN